MADLETYVDRSISQWTRMNGGEAPHSAFYDKLSVRASGMSAAYLAKYMRTGLEESADLAPLRNREDFQSLLARLTELEADERSGDPAESD